MTCWTNLLSDTSALRGVFGEDTPSFSDIELHEISLHRDGPKAMLRFDLSDYPLAPPKRWLVAGFNRVQMKILAVDVSDFSVAGWGLKNKCKATAFLKNGSIFFQAEGGGLKISFSANHLFIDSLSAYRDSPSKA